MQYICIKAGDGEENRIVRSLGRSSRSSGVNIECLHNICLQSRYIRLINSTRFRQDQEPSCPETKIKHRVAEFCVGLC